jgi:hypothetical protein
MDWLICDRSCGVDTTCVILLSTSLLRFRPQSSSRIMMAASCTIGTFLTASSSLEPAIDCPLVSSSSSSSSSSLSSPGRLKTTPPGLPNFLLFPAPLSCTPVGIVSVPVLLPGPTLASLLALGFRLSRLARFLDVLASDASWRAF